MNLLYLLKKLFGIKCDKCGRKFTTERGKNIHRASHKNRIYALIRTLDNGKTETLMGGSNKWIEVQKYSHNPLEGQDVELFLRGSKK